MSALASPPAVRPSRRPPRARARRVWLWAGLALVWAVLMRKFGGTDLYSLLGPYAAAVSLVSIVEGGPRLRELFRPDARALIAGFAVGGVMIAGTYPAYHLAATTFPALRPIVRSLYAATETTALPLAMAWASVIVLAEELLWRGVGLHELSRYLRVPGAAAVSVASYALAQLGTGSWIVGLVALVCGALWTLERLYTRSLLAPLISHWLWTNVVILLYPLS